MDISFQPIPNFEDAPLAAYRELFSFSFPTAINRFTDDYLRWLYFCNPAGNAVGYDAWDGNVLAAHYVCVPLTISLRGKTVPALLSLNTATHPKYQGKGLFTKLAERTYEKAISSGFACVVGIANANSTPGFLRKLGFGLVGPLSAKIGLGEFKSSWPGNLSNIEFMQVWTADSLQWRSGNPSNPVALTNPRPGLIACNTNSQIWGISAYAELPSVVAEKSLFTEANYFSPIKVYVGSFPSRLFPSHFYEDIPQRFRPSPLNFIFKSLQPDVTAPATSAVLLSFMDFDAY